MSCDMSKYLNQQVTLGKASGIDDYGQYERENQVINCRMEERTRVARNSYGEEVMSNNTIFTTVEVGAHDTINAHPIISISKMIAVDGGVLGYEVLI